jgi:hypothetical protein
LIYRLNTNEFTADYYDEFYSPPARAVADSLATALNYDLPYLLVRTQGVRNPDYALEITVLDFYGDLSSEPQTVKVSLVATLNDLKPALPHLLFSRKYVRSLPIQLNLNETQAESFVKVLVAALAQIKGDLAFDLKEVLRVK